jgi:hypothetical protein
MFRGRFVKTEMREFWPEMVRLFDRADRLYPEHLHPT